MKNLIEQIEKKRLEMKDLMRELTENHTVIRVSIDGYEEGEYLSIMLGEKDFLRMFSDFEIRKLGDEKLFPYELTHRDGGIHYCTLLDEYSYQKHIQGG